MDATPVLLRLPRVMQMTGLARSTIYKLIAAKEFPTPVRITGRSVAWRSQELGQWCENRSRAGGAH